MSTRIRGTYTCIISYNMDTQITTLLTSSLRLNTKFTFETLISLPGLPSLTFNALLAISWLGESSQDLFFHFLSPFKSLLPLHCNRSHMTLSFRFCAPNLCFIVSQHAFTEIYPLPSVRKINYIPKKNVENLLYRSMNLTASI